MPRRGSAFGLAGLLLCGCVTATAPPANRPLAEWDASAEVPEIARLREHRSGEILLGLTFSSGGTRSAAFAYGVLEALADTEVVADGQTRRLLDEVDLISSVAGGSFTAAYEGLFGERIFTDFERAFLQQIETSFNLSNDKVDRLIAAGRDLIHTSAELKQALATLEESVIDD